MRWKSAENKESSHETQGLGHNKQNDHNPAPEGEPLPKCFDFFSEKTLSEEGR